MPDETVLGPIEGGQTPGVANASPSLHAPFGGAGLAGATAKRTITVTEEDSPKPLVLNLSIPILGRFGDVVKVAYVQPITRVEAELLRDDLDEFLRRPILAAS